MGWSAYTDQPEVLLKGINNSSFLATAVDDQGRLLGMVRAISDDATICYVQDILVRPDSQGSGVGRTLLEEVLKRYSHLRQTVLLTDDEPAQRAFYQALGFTEGSEMEYGPLRVFIQFR